MSTVKRRRGKSLHLELPHAGTDEEPAIAALFLVQFDVKAGYTIAWKRSVDGLQLADSVEFKSLPSGLHNVKEDLVYFMHGDEYVGISAFVNKSDSGQERNALMLAIGALVPLSKGLLGRSWKHAGKLKDLAQNRELLQDPKKTECLEEFWEENRISDEDAAAASDSPFTFARRQSEGSPNGIRKRGGTMSSSSAPGPLGQILAPYHPALSLPSLFDTFGPLTYPLYKAALLRKRILMVTQAPIELPCNFVYDVSILSSIPSYVSERLPLEPLPTKLQTLFSIGVHDIEDLTRGTRNKSGTNGGILDGDPDFGWIACTTDDVLATKSKLYDVLVIIPPSYTKQAKEKVWPRMSNTAKLEIKASQRDLRRYRTLRQGLRRFQTRSQATLPYGSGRRQSEVNNDQSTLLPVANTQETFDDASSTIDEKMIEPPSWSSLAYSSFMWWASAGEKRADLDEEVEHDAALLRDQNDHSNVSPSSPTSRRRSIPNPMGGMEDGLFRIPEMAIIAYFHRLTALILNTLADIVEAEDAPADSNDQEPLRTEDADDKCIRVRSEDMTRMGLDSWSEGDKKFVRELLELYWGRRSEVQGARVECCGVRIV